MTHTDITTISFNQSLVEQFIPGFNGVFDILRRLGVRTMSDVLPSMSSGTARMTTWTTIDI